MRIAFSLPDGQVGIISSFQTNPDVPPTTKPNVEELLGREITDEEYAAIVRRAIPAHAGTSIVLPDDWVPLDYERRAEWRIVDGELVIPE